MRKDPGGPAFPVHPEYLSLLNAAASESDCGMTLRDYFAAKAMQCHMTEGYDRNKDGCGHFTNEQVAEFSYELADAMLEARNK